MFASPLGNAPDPDVRTTGHQPAQSENEMNQNNARQQPVFLTSADRERNVQNALRQNMPQNVPVGRPANAQRNGGPRYPQLTTVPNRWATFANFPPNLNVSHQQMAVAGFFYTGNTKCTDLKVHIFEKTLDF